MPQFIPQYVDDRLDLKIFNRLRVRYIVALMAIAIAVLSSEMLVKNFLKKQLFDSRIVNVAGRQRMLSQKITKEVLLISQAEDAVQLENYLDKLEGSLSLWMRSHEGLQKGDSALGLPARNSQVIDSMFRAVKPEYDSIVRCTQHILNASNEDLLQNRGHFRKCFTTILRHEPHFLEAMDNIVFQYDAEAKKKVDQLIYTESILLFGALLILFFEFVFIFTPVARHVRNIVSGLIDSEEKEKKMNKELRKLYESLEESQRELNEIYYAVDHAIMYARTNKQGVISFLSDKFKTHLGMSRTPIGKNLFDLLRFQQLSKEDLLQTLKLDKGLQIWKNEVLTLDGEKRESWLMITIVPVPDPDNLNYQLVIVASDINERKLAEEKLKVATKEKIKRQEAEQKLKSSLILEGQERERRRISRDIHDGIGQLLTGLKFQLESMDWSQYDKSREKINDIKVLTTNIIKEVRRVSSNLAPSVLNDYGLISALNTLIQDLQSITHVHVQIENITNFNVRLIKKAEINIFRIIQESVNNALKHAKAENILISISHTEEELIIIIEDDGIGFDTRNLKMSEVEKMRGHGIFNMKERAGFLEAELALESSPGKGTSLTLELPYKNYLR